MLPPQTRPGDEGEEEEEEEGFLFFFFFFAACSRLAQVISPDPAVLSHTWGSSGVLTGRSLQVSQGSPGKSSSSSPQIKAVVVQKKRSKRSRSGWGASLRPPASLQRKCLISSCPLERARLCKTWTDEVCYYYSPTLLGLNKRCRKRKTVKLIHVNFNDFVTDFFLHFFRFFTNCRSCSVYATKHGQKMSFKLTNFTLRINKLHLWQQQLLIKPDQIDLIYESESLLWINFGPFFLFFVLCRVLADFQQWTILKHANPLNRLPVSPKYLWSFLPDCVQICVFIVPLNWFSLIVVTPGEFASAGTCWQEVHR